MLVAWEMRFEMLTKLKILPFFFFLEASRYWATMVFPYMLPEHLCCPSQSHWSIKTWSTKNISNGLWLFSSDILCVFDLLWVACNTREVHVSSKPRQVLKPSKIGWNWKSPMIKNSGRLRILCLKFPSDFKYYDSFGIFKVLNRHRFWIQNSLLTDIFIWWNT